MPEKKRVSMMVFWMGVSRKETVRAAEIADEAGIDSIWIPEAWGYDQVTLVTEIALRTKRIRIGTGIMNCFSRSPGVVAITAATLDDVSGGRFILGLGTSGKNVIEGFHGIPFEKPIQRLREYVEIVRLLLAGERLAKHHGEVFPSLRPFKLVYPPAGRKVPIHVASLARKSVQMAGEIADGWLPAFWPLHLYKEGLGWIAEGAALAGRDPKQIEIAPFIGTSVNDDLETAKAIARGPVGFYIGGMGKFYSQLLTRAGFGPEVERVKKLYDEGKRDEAFAAVDDKIIEATGAVGTMEAVRAKLDVFRAAGVTNPIVSCPIGVDEKTVEKFIRGIAA